jgi:hypothetical protein
MLTAKPGFIGFARILFTTAFVSLETGRVPVSRDNEDAFSAQSEYNWQVRTVAVVVYS